MAKTRTATTRRAEIAVLLGAAIREVRQDRHESQMQISERLGINQTVLSRWELGRNLPSLVEIELIDDALRLPPGGILIRAGLVELPDRNSAPTAAALAADPIISIEDKRALLHFYEQAFMAAAERNATKNGNGSRPAGGRDVRGRSRPASR